MRELLEEISHAQDVITSALKDARKKRLSAELIEALTETLAMAKLSKRAILQLIDTEAARKERHLLAVARSERC